MRACPDNVLISHSCSWAAAAPVDLPGHVATYLVTTQSRVAVSTASGDGLLVGNRYAIAQVGRTVCCNQIPPSALVVIIQVSVKLTKLFNVRCRRELPRRQGIGCYSYVLLRVRHQPVRQARISIVRTDHCIVGEQ